MRTWYDVYRREITHELVLSLNGLISEGKVGFVVLLGTLFGFQSTMVVDSAVHFLVGAALLVHLNVILVLNLWEGGS